MLRIYYKNSEDAYVPVSIGNDISSPIDTVHDGKMGTTTSVLLYLRNNDSSKYYTNIRIFPTDLEETNSYSDVMYDETGWGVKLSAGGTEPSEAEWENIDWGNEIQMSNIGTSSVGNTTTYYPFWYLISSPPNLDAQAKIDIALTTYYTDNAVT
jgi:hypothetical protein